MGLLEAEGDGSVRLKSYFADTIEAAMTLAAKELGEDALLVYSREASPEAKYLGGYEVVFGSGEAKSSPEIAAAPAAMPVVAPPVPASSDQLGWASTALAELKSEIGSLRRDVAAHRRRMEDFLRASDRRAWRLLADWGSEPELLPGVALAGRLLQSDMDPEHVLDVIECVRDSVRAAGGANGERADAETWKHALIEELSGRRRTDVQLGQAGRRPAVVLIGPPGCGRTTAAMQLAAHATGRGLEPRLIAFEPGRLTAAQALRSYAAVLSAPFELVRRGDHLAGLLAARDADTLTIVDGPGIGGSPDDGSAQLAALGDRAAGVETWLVLPASLRASDLQRLIERFSRYRPARLVFTRTTETRHWGPVWSAAEWAGLPLAFFCDGPRIPEDWKAARPEAIAGWLLTGDAATMPGGSPDLGRDQPWPLAAGQVRQA